MLRLSNNFDISVFWLSNVFDTAFSGLFQLFTHRVPCLPSLIYNDLRISSSTSIFTNKKIFLIRHDSITSAASRDLYLIPQVYFLVLKQLYGLPVWKGILQVDIKSVQPPHSSFLPHFSQQSVPQIEFIHLPPVIFFSIPQMHGS